MLAKPRPTKFLTALLSTTALGMTGQSVAAQPRDESSEQTDSIFVYGKRRSDYLEEDLSLKKLPSPLQDTPQSITTLPRALLEDQAVTSLDEAFRNVPGITLGAGEFSWQGNNPSIRGFSSRNDMFLDGMRDYGSYFRDPFNLEAVEVLEGPSSMIFGRGSTGGVINQVSKTPFQEKFAAVNLNFGTDLTRRATTDLSLPAPALGSGASFRLNAMGHQSEVAGRDGAEYRRFGIAPSLAMDLGAATRLSLSYLHQTNNDTPDYGHPWFGNNTVDIPRENFYGFASDFIKTSVDILTARVESDFNSAMTGRVTARYAHYDRDTRITEPLIDPAIPATTPLEDVTVDRFVFRGESEESMLAVQADLTAKFDMGGVGHVLVVGIEASHERSAPSFGFGVGVPGVDLLNPGVSDDFSATSIETLLVVDTTGDTLGVYAIDTLEIADWLQIIGGVRWDRFKVDYSAERFEPVGNPTPFLSPNVMTGSEEIEQVDEAFSYRAAAVFKPYPAASFYFGFGTSFNPSAEGLSFVTSGRGLGLGNAALEPEENRSYEIGGKFSLLDDALALNVALFRISKVNARVPDPDNPGFNTLGGTQQVDGLSVSAVGYLTPKWQVSSGYTYLDGEVTETVVGGPAVGSPLQNVARNAFTFWNAYQLNDRFQIGGGARYVGARNATAAKMVPAYWTFDLMGGYRINERLGFKVNLTNITDKFYYAGIHPWHIVPGPGATAMFAINLEY